MSMYFFEDGFGFSQYLINFTLVGKTKNVYVILPSKKGIPKP